MRREEQRDEREKAVREKLLAAPLYF